MRCEHNFHVQYVVACLYTCTYSVSMYIHKYIHMYSPTCLVSTLKGTLNLYFIVQ